MYRVMKWAPGVDMVMLSRHFVVVKLAQWVVVAPGKLRWSPPTVTWTRFTSALVGLMEEKIRAYVTLRTWGIADFAIKKTVLVPFCTRLPTPWARRPKSLASALIQVSPLGTQMRCRYLSAWLLVGLMTTLACSSLWIKLAEGGNITRLCAALPAVTRRWTGSRS